MSTFYHQAKISKKVLNAWIRAVRKQGFDPHHLDKNIDLILDKEKQEYSGPVWISFWSKFVIFLWFLLQKIQFSSVDTEAHGQIWLPYFKLTDWLHVILQHSVLGNFIIEEPPVNFNGYLFNSYKKYFLYIHFLSGMGILLLANGFADSLVSCRRIMSQ